YYVFQAEDGIRDATVTGVQTCALPISFQILADQPLGQALGSQPTLSPWENAPSAPEIVFLHDALLDWFVQVCGQQVRRRGEILLDIDSTDDPTYGHQQLSFFNGAYNQHM